MKKSKLLLGDEALALGAMDAGVKCVYGYPGTPSTEIFEAAEEYIKKIDDGRVSMWAANEKVAYELALGTSYTGQRTVVTMKHVGLNVAFDAFVNSALTGVNGGMIVAVADDPGMHSSQNEQDTRPLADFAHLPLLEPTTPQEVYDFTIAGFEISEKLKLPVVVKLVTRLAHSRGEVFRRDDRLSPTTLGIPSKEEKNNWVLVPSIARVRFVDLKNKYSEMLKISAGFNKAIYCGKKIGVVISGMGIAYFDHYIEHNNISKEMFNQLRIKSYPVDKTLLQDFVRNNESVFVFEENYPYLEDLLLGYSLDKKCIIHGRRDCAVPQTGELSLGIIRKTLAFEPTNPKLTDAKKREIDKIVSSRPPKLCDGCGHTDAFKSLTTALKNIGIDDYRIFGDIGCYTLGVMPPHMAIHSCVEMGASLSMALGAALAGHTPSVGVIGDSTFFHSGMTTLISAVQAKVNINMVVMDNSIVGMTGQQPPVTIGICEDLAIAAGLPKEDIHVLTPLPKQHSANVDTLEKIFKKNGPSLIIFKRECIQALRRKLYPHQQKKEVANE